MDYFASTSNPQYSEFIALSRYARFDDEKGRREIWPETVERLINFWKGKYPEHSKVLEKKIQPAILHLETMPSMRSLMTAGEALDRCNVAGYNCSFVAVESPRDFDEILYILMNGTGVGYSVERQYVTKLPEVAEEFHATSTVIQVKDSKLGWAKAYKELLSLLWQGEVPEWDLSKVRPAGARLKTFGGRASGPAPLDSLFRFSVEMFKKAAGRKLTSLECHDLVCKIADIVVVGGVRRCLPEGSLIHTDKGMVPIEDVQPGYHKALTTDGYHPVTNKFNQGQQDLLTIQTQTGSFSCTPNHKMAVLQSAYGDYSWVKAEDLQEGDRLLHTTSVIDGVDTHLPKSSYVRPAMAYTAKPVEIPTLDEDMAWFIGYYHANGHSAIRQSGPGKRNSVISVSVPNTAPQVVDKCYEQLSKFGVNVRINEGDGACKNLKATSVELALWMAEHIKTSNEEFDVPDFIMQAKPEIRSAYVAGVMDGDGSISNRPIQIMSCIHQGYLQQLQAVCASLGVATRVRLNRPAQGNWKPLYQLCLKGSKQERQFTLTVGKYLIYKVEPPRSRKAEQFSYSLPAGMVRQAEKEHRVGYHQNYNVNCPIELWEEISGMESQFTPVSVIGIEEGGVEYTWDIEVADKHEFFCNGILTHNSALISLSNLSDDRMRNAKSGQWWQDNPQRALANNSYVADERPDFEIFLEEWMNLYKSRSGERGIFSRRASQKQADNTGRRESNHDFGTNPCSEIILRNKQFCNLSEVVIRPTDDLESLLVKVENATIIGTFQSTLTDFRYLRKKWKENTEEERLLGVSMTGIMDHPILSDSKKSVEWLDAMREHAIKVNKEWSAKLGINQSVSITAVKPSGTVSQLVDSSSGIHPRFSDYYLRTVRADKKDPLATFMIDKGFYAEEDQMNPSNWVFYFPMKSPEGSVTASDMGALKQLELWKVYQDHWCEHKPSMTCYYKDSEFMEVGNWVWNHFNEISGVSFLPVSDHIYPQAPYQPISEKEYGEWMESMPKDVDWTELVQYEQGDTTISSQELACSGGNCEIK